MQLEKAHKNFGQIELLCQVGYWDNVANRLYYALFHAVSALLISEGHKDLDEFFQVDATKKQTTIHFFY